MLVSAVPWMWIAEMEAGEAAAELGRCHRPDGSEDPGIARQPVGHDAPVGDTGGVETRPVDRSLTLDDCDHLGDEADIADVRAPGGAAATAAGVPGPAEPVRVGDEEPPRICLGVPAVGPFRLGAAAKAAMQHPTSGTGPPAS